jgi:ribosome assembly protein YihI (activator of Der GTPase)
MKKESESQARSTKKKNKKGGNGNEAKSRHERIKEQKRKKNMYRVWRMIYCRIPFIVVLEALPCCSPLSKLFASVVGGIVGI